MLHACRVNLSTRPLYESLSRNINTVLIELSSKTGKIPPFFLEFVRTLFWMNIYFRLARHLRKFFLILSISKYCLNFFELRCIKGASQLLEEEEKSKVLFCRWTRSLISGRLMNCPGSKYTGRM